MKLVSIFNLEHFTKGKEYFVVDYIPDNIGYIVYDDQNVEHGITYKFASEHFVTAD